MFTRDQERAAAELIRVCKPGGKIGLANWTPASFIGQLFRAIGNYIPPSGARSPPLWGTRERLADLFGDSALSIASTSRHFVFRYRSGQHWLDVFRNTYGPMHKAFGALSEETQRLLTEDLLALVARFNRSGDSTMVIPSEYLEVVIAGG
jgi:hypothetical protein